MRLCVIGRSGWLLEAARRLADLGHEIAVVVTARETAESTAQAGDFEALAAACGASFHRSVNASRDDILAALAKSSPELALTMNFPGILDERFVAVFPRGVVNCHGSLLPRYRGNACPNWAIVSGDHETGLSLHYIRPRELDTGAILLQRAFPLDDDTDITDVYRWYDGAIPDAFVALVDGLVSDRLTPREQDEGLATYAFPRRPEDARLDFRCPSLDVLRTVRASSRPFPGAFCYFERETRVTVWKARPGRAAGPIHAIPGQITEVDDQGRPTVWCADGAVTFVDFESDKPLQLGRRSRFA